MRRALVLMLIAATSVEATACRHAPQPAASREASRSAEWLELTRSVNGVFYVDTTTFQATDATHATLTLRFEPLHPLPVFGVKTPVSATETFETVDCAQNGEQVDSLRAFDANGRVVLSLPKGSAPPMSMGPERSALCDYVAKRAGAGGS